jgi:hypothetical protein
MHRTHARPRAAITAAAVAAVITVTASLAVTATATTRPAGSDLLYQQGFSGGSVPSSDWIAGGAGGSPCLTAGNPASATAIPSCTTARDSDGRGVLRLTSNKKYQTGYVLYTQPLAANRGLDVSFNMYQYDTTTASRSSWSTARPHRRRRGRSVARSGTRGSRAATSASASMSSATSPARRSGARATAWTPASRT